jgi:1-aminocyclopropane-1-carboxylate deaminase/D-cysteine desulfhydrase-like pyridoxal-dependent ACC family enzyme
MQFESKIIPLQVINDSITKKYGINLYILRTDLPHPPFRHLLHEEKGSGNNFLHPNISGNKLFKLKYNLQEAINQDKKILLTFGGAFSNHIAATAAAGKEYHFKTIGIIRGEKHSNLNPTLKFASDCGMELHYVSRTLYQNKNELNEYVNRNFSEHNSYIISEGGSNELGIKGCEEITQSINIDFDYVCTACGTGATMTGIILALKKNQKAIGFQILKAENYIKNEVEEWLNKFANNELIKEDKKSGNNSETIQTQSNWEINDNYHFRGYAKVNQKLKDFVQQFEETNNIPLDFIYTGKMMFGIYDMIKKDFFKKDETIVAIHTGGLQGNAGFHFLEKNRTRMPQISQIFTDY